MSSLFALRESVQQMSFKLNSLGATWEIAPARDAAITAHSAGGVLAFTIAYFPMPVALVLLAAFFAYLVVTKSLTVRGLLFGLPTVFVVFSLSFMAVIALSVFSSLHLPQLIFFYFVLRLPMFFGLVLALWVAHHFSRLFAPFTQIAGLQSRGGAELDVMTRPPA